MLRSIIRAFFTTQSKQRGFTKARPTKSVQRLKSRTLATAGSSFDESTSTRLAEHKVISGSAYVIDGDSIVVKQTQIRLFGVDAPELNHPFGQKAKWAMVNLCKGQQIRAEVTEQDAHGRTVAKCYLEDGRDLSAELVKLGLAVDWPKFSGGKYRSLEPPGIRKKLWLADARQKGRRHAWRQFELSNSNK